jgi:hypothetical protein
MASRKDVLARAVDLAHLMDEHFGRAARGEYQEVAPLKADLDYLFGITAFGFREILLVIVLAKLRDPAYDATTDFYACNPRAIYEGPIRKQLTDRKIPRMASGPLNIAKGSQGIHQAWAARRRPSGAGEAVLRLLAEINTAGAGALANLATWVHAKFLEPAMETASLTIEVPPESDPVLLAELCASLIDRAPDAGNTPQRIVGYLLEAYHEVAGTQVVVQGHLDRASTTNKTSKKPGDISEHAASGALLSVYEVTVKGFGGQRVQEAYDSIVAYGGEGVAIPEVTVLCRPLDIHPDATTDSKSAMLLGAYEFNSLRFLFVDLWEWITAQLLRIPVNGRSRFYEKLNRYVADANVARKVKEVWRELRQTSPSFTPSGG